MRVWSASAIGRYYLDPAIEFIQAGNRDTESQSAAGYYIVPHCGPDCCQAFGGVATTDLGPFSTRTKARKWSRRYLVESGGPAH